MSTTTDLAKFGMREIEELSKILNAWLAKGLPADFSQDEVHPMFNMSSGNVFLTNADYQVAMLTDGELESFYSCPECGNEGFYDDMQICENNSSTRKCCETYVRECAGAVY